MDSTKQILQLLLDGHAYSGTELGLKLGISRAAVWKHIQKLVAKGLDITTTRGKGYQLNFESELLAEQKIISYLCSDSQQLIRGIDVFFEIDSTNQYLLQKSMHGNVHGTIALAEYQTAGKGRRGRQWFSPPASGLCLSIAWNYDDNPQLLHCLPLSMGLAITKVLESYQCPPLQLKWPNDIYFHGQKLAGLLLETRSENAGECCIVIGLGLNIYSSRTHRQQLDQAMTALADITDAPINRNQLAAKLIMQIIALLEDFSAARARHDLEDWRRRDYLYGKQITVVSSGDSFDGKACGIDDNGLLQVMVNGNIQSLYSAEVSLKLSK